MPSKRDIHHLRADPFIRAGNDREKRKDQVRLHCTLYPRCTWYATVKQEPGEHRQKDNDRRLVSAAGRRDKHMAEKHNERMPWG